MKKSVFSVICLFFLCQFSYPLFTQIVNEEEKDTTKTYPLNEIVITGTRTTKKIIDVPYSVQRIDAPQYRFARKIAVNDILSDIPGLFLQNRYGNHDVRISIRGFGSRSNSGIRGVRILLDGIPESEPDGQTRIEAIDFHSVGSIEVVKGNASSLYTNAPGGVINFINDLFFHNTFFSAFYDVGSFGLSNSGFKTGIRTDKYRFLTTYKYHSSRGYRQHSEDYWHVMNTALQSSPGDFSHLYLYGYFVDGMIRLPGSLTKKQFEQDPFQANQRDVDRDAKRISKKGRVGARFNSFFGEQKNNELEITAYGTIKYFERTAKTYRIINRTGIGSSARFVNHSTIFGRRNEFSVGGDLFYQSGPIEEYKNISGQKGDELLTLTENVIANTGFYFQNSFSIINNRLDFLFTGRYDKVVFEEKNQILQVQNSSRLFEAFTPKFALNYKLTPKIAAYTSYGLSFDSPAANELDNFPTSTTYPKLLNPDLQAQKSKNFEIGTKGNLLFDNATWFRYVYFDVVFFNLKIDDEIVPFEVMGEVFYRNAAKTNRSGLEIGLNTNVISGLKVKTSYTLSDFKYDAYTARIIRDDAAGNTVTEDENFTGKVPPSIPKHNLTISTIYEHNLLESVIGFVKLNSHLVSGLFTDDGNTEKTDGYNLLNVTIGLDWSNGPYQIVQTLGVNNIFNRTYAAFININSTRKEFYEAGEPRNLFASIKVGYNF